MRSGKKTRGNMLFYNLYTADLTGNEYTDSRLESWDAAFGERQGWSAGLCWPRTAPAGTTGLRRGVNRGGCAEYPEEEGQPRFPRFPPYPAAGGSGAVPDWWHWWHWCRFGVVCCAWGAPEGSQPLRLPRSSCGTPSWRSFGADTLLHPFPRAGVGAGGAGGAVVTPALSRASGGPRAPGLPLPSLSSLPSVPGSLKV